METKSKWLLLAFAVYLYFQAQRVNPDPVPPGPNPGPAPIVADGLRVLIVEETDPRSPTAALVINSGAWREYVITKGGKFRVWDDDLTDADLQHEKDKEFVAAYKRQRTASPWVIVSDGKSKGEEGPLPTTPQAMVDLAKKYGE